MYKSKPLSKSSPPSGGGGFFTPRASPPWRGKARPILLLSGSVPLPLPQVHGRDPRGPPGLFRSRSGRCRGCAPLPSAAALSHPLRTPAKHTPSAAAFSGDLRRGAEAPWRLRRRKEMVGPTVLPPGGRNPSSCGPWPQIPRPPLTSGWRKPIPPAASPPPPFTQGRHRGIRLSAEIKKKKAPGGALFFFFFRYFFSGTRKIKTRLLTSRR